MGTGHIGHQHHLRFGQGAGPGDFTGGIGAQFDDRITVFAGQTQQRQRHTDVIVEVATGGQGALAQHGGGHFLDGGLAGIAGYRQALTGKLVRIATGQTAQTQAGIVDLHGAGKVTLLTIHQGGDGATFSGLGKKIMGIKTLALERHKQAARRHVTGIGHYGADLVVFPDQSATGPLGDLRQPHHEAPPRAARAWRASSLSSLG